MLLSLDLFLYLLSGNSQWNASALQVYQFKKKQEVSQVLPFVF